MADLRFKEFRETQEKKKNVAAGVAAPFLGHSQGILTGFLEDCSTIPERFQSILKAFLGHPWGFLTHA